MRISDWSSDVCSSDLLPGEHAADAPLIVYPPVGAAFDAPELTGLAQRRAGVDAITLERAQEVGLGVEAGEAEAKGRIVPAHAHLVLIGLRRLRVGLVGARSRAGGAPELGDLRALGEGRVDVDVVVDEVDDAGVEQGQVEVIVVAAGDPAGHGRRLDMAAVTLVGKATRQAKVRSVTPTSNTPSLMRSPDAAY